MKWLRRRWWWLTMAVPLCFVIVVLLLIVAIQGKRTPPGEPYYVALGSSFAAGAGLGPLQPGSPWLCARSVNGYPQQLARRRHWPIVDMSCGGAVTRHVLRGGQLFQGPQLRVVDRRTRIITVTVGGNDIGYIGDLSMLAARHTDTLFGRMVRWFWKGPAATDRHRYDALRSELTATLDAVHARAPEALVVVATYPTILPPHGTCPALGLTDAEANEMRQVASDLASSTAAAARAGHARLVDMNDIGRDHHACAADPWTRGWTNGGIAPFHPTLAGAQATAAAISAAIGDRLAPR